MHPRRARVFTTLPTIDMEILLNTWSVQPEEIFAIFSTLNQGCSKSLSTFIAITATAIVSVTIAAVVIPAVS